MIKIFKYILLIVGLVISFLLYNNEYNQSISVSGIELLKIPNTTKSVYMLNSGVTVVFESNSSEAISVLKAKALNFDFYELLIYHYIPSFILIFYISFLTIYILNKLEH